MLTPAIHTTRKSLPSELNDEEVIARACQAAVGVPIPLPVMSAHGKLLGIAKGFSYTSPYVAWCNKRHFGYTTYDDFISKTTNLEQKYTTVWGKSFSNAIRHGWVDLWPLAPNPVSGDYSGTAVTARQFSDSTPGAMIHGGNVTPKSKSIINSWMRPVGIFHTFMLYDRVLAYDNSPYSTGGQAMTNTLPALRYIN